MILISIGTQPSNRITFDKNNPKYKYVSSRHAELLLLQDGSIYLTDRSSTNGTKVNGRKIEPETEVSVKRGDQITFADCAKLDWNLVPVIPPIDPQLWDVYSIGSDFRNRIKLTDSSNSVSRFHAVVKVNKKTGKVFITDHSSNGTFINGNRIPSGVETPVKYKTAVTLANIPLDWSRIKRPNPPMGIILKAATAVAAVVVIGLGIWQWDAVKGLFGSGSSWEDYQSATVLVYNAYYYDVIFDDDVLGTATYGVMVDEDGDPSGDFGLMRNRDVVAAESVGTGFFVSKDGKIITNKHIVEPWEYLESKDNDQLRQVVAKDLNNTKSELYIYLAEKADDGNLTDLNALWSRISNLRIKKITGHSVRLRVGFYDKYYESYEKFEACTPLKSSENNDIDLAVIQINDKSLPSFIKSTVDISNSINNSSKLKIGDRLTTIGYPSGTASNYRLNEGGLKPVMKSGDLQRDPSGNYFDIDVEIIGGASGSPVFNHKKELVGVINSRMSNAATTGHGILAKHINKLLEDAN